MKTFSCIAYWLSIKFVPTEFEWYVQNVNFITPIKPMLTEFTSFKIDFFGFLNMSM